MQRTHHGGGSRSLCLLPLIFQVLLIVLYGVFVRYDEIESTAVDPSADNSTTNRQVPPKVYAMFQDIHVMIFVGFGFLMTFLRKYGYSALGFTWLIGALVIQWAFLCQSFFHMEDNIIKLTLVKLVEADIMAATVLISFGAVLGRTTVPQLIIMAIIETAVACSNLYIMTDIFMIADCGGSIAIHTFGAYFGLAASLVLRAKKVNAVQDQQSSQDKQLEGSSYSSDITAMIGSLFLWIFWPSFNAGLLTNDNGQYKAVVNTYLSLASAAMTAFVLSALVTPGRKFDMVHVQNSTLAGGVAIGSVCNMYVHPFGALCIGMGAGIISVIGYKYITPTFERRLGLKDTCGVHNLHGMPGVCSGLLSILFAALATEDLYESTDNLHSVFVGMKPDESTGVGRDSTDQALFQLKGLAVTLLIALVSGAITGCIMRLPCLNKMKTQDNYDDNWHWELPGAQPQDNSTVRVGLPQAVELTTTVPPKY